MKYILSIDLGTTSMKAVLFDGTLSAVARAKVDYSTDYPAPGWAEQDVKQWWDALKTAVGTLLNNPSAPDPAEIAIIAIDAMTPTVVPVDREGKALRKAIIWMDRRSDAECRLIDNALGDDLFKISGNHNDPSNFSPKMRWVKEHEPDIYHRAEKFLLENAYLVHRLTGEFSMDETQCGLSQLCDTLKGEWSDTLIQGSGLDREKLPSIYRSTDIVGCISTAAAVELGLSTQTGVIAGAMDNVAAGLGAGILGDGDLYISAGTATNVSLCTVEPRFHKSFHIYQHIVPGRWIHTAGVDYGGAGYKWFAKLIGENDYASLDSRADAVNPGDRPLIFLPYMVGQRAPLWNSHTRGVLFGMDPSMSDGELARGFMEGNAYGTRRILELTRELGVLPTEGKLTGGCSESRVYSQIFADVLGVDILRVGEMDTAPLGIAMAGARAAGIFDDFESIIEMISARGNSRGIHTPEKMRSEFYSAGYKLFDILYRQLEPVFSELSALSSQEELT
ncbi:MAG: hypothetical protein KAH21_09080 [Spirochaetaceae bacterium]|nr:hypothetical protein [Spirochaetaceae bacterium]